MTDGIHARLIVEMLGKPKDYIQQTLHNFVEKFAQKLDIVKREFAEPKEQDGKLFSVFVELEIRFRNVAELFGFCLDAMPSSVEIVAPEQLSFDSVHLGEFLNDIQSKLHQTDMLVKTLSAQNKHLDKNATNVFYNFLLYLLRENPRKLQALSPHVGLQDDLLKPFLDQLISQKKVVLKGDVYAAL